MANRAYLYNADAPGTVARSEDGIDKVAEWDRAIPVPCLLAFRGPDLLARDDGGFTPCASLEKVLANLRAAVPVMRKLVADPRLAQAYLDDAIRAFSTLRRPYVMLDVDELVDGDWLGLRRALGEGDAAAAQLRLWSSCEVAHETVDPRGPVPVDRRAPGLWCGFGPGPTAQERQAWKEWRKRETRGWQDTKRRAKAGDLDAIDEMVAEGAASEALPYLERVASEGNVEAQARLSNHLAATGAHRRAHEWLERAAEAGHAGAACTLGMLYLGKEAGQDEAGSWGFLGPEARAAQLDLSARWLSRGIAAGCRDAVSNYIFGDMLRDGRLVPRDPAKAARCFAVAAEAGLDAASGGEVLARLVARSRSQ